MVWWCGGSPLKGCEKLLRQSFRNSRCVKASIRLFQMEQETGLEMKAYWCTEDRGQVLIADRMHRATSSTDEWGVDSSQIREVLVVGRWANGRCNGVQR